MPDGGYQLAWVLLDKRYGRNTDMMNLYYDTILNYPVIKAGDVDSLDKFSLILANASNAMLILKSVRREIESAKTIRQIVAKLLFSIQERFCRLVDRTEDDGDSVVSFQTLVDFLADEVRIASHPIFRTETSESWETRESRIY